MATLKVAKVAEILHNKITASKLPNLFFFSFLATFGVAGRLYEDLPPPMSSTAGSKVATEKAETNNSLCFHFFFLFQLSLLAFRGIGYRSTPAAYSAPMTAAATGVCPRKEKKKPLLLLWRNIADDAMRGRKLQACNAYCYRAEMHVGTWNLNSYRANTQTERCE
jgi:hypothetical protein